MEQGKRKLAFAINGRGSVGKDTMADYAANTFDVRNVSSIEPIKQIARVGGWKDADKQTSEGRQLLVDLKELFVAYNDLPQQYLLEQYKQFMESNQDFMFAHIREPEEIKKFQLATGAKSLLITRTEVLTEWDIANERNVSNYIYDHTFDNYGQSVEESGDRFVKFLEDIRNSI